MQPKVSIIVPCWGVEKYLDRCMESLVGQTLKEIEIILVDDESPDRVPEMCDEWVRKAESLELKDFKGTIKVVHKRNGGLGYARNSGLEVAQGEYVMFIDSDDAIKLDVCERFYNVAKQHDADVVTGNFNTEYLPGRWHKTEQPEGRQVLHDGEVRQYMLDMIATAPHVKQERLYPVSVCLLCVRRSIIENKHLRFMSEREVASEDTVFKISLLHCCKVLVREPYAFYSYYLNGGSLTRSFSLSKFKQLKKLYTTLSELLKDDEEAISRVQRFLISDTRPHVQRLVQSNIPNKIAVLKEMLNDELWDMVKGYLPANFPAYQRFFYKLTLSKHVHLLYGYAWIANTIKNIRK